MHGDTVEDWREFAQFWCLHQECQDGFIALWSQPAWEHRANQNKTNLSKSEAVHHLNSKSYKLTAADMVLSSTQTIINF